MNDLAIYQELVRLTETGAVAALVTVVETGGSSPRKAGAKMLVRQDGATMGTVGGGKVELETVAAALAAMGEGKPRTVSFTLTEEHGFACGGHLLVYIEPLAPPPRLIIAGAGHVGRALATVAKAAGFRVIVADDREGFATATQVPDADETLLIDYGSLFDQLEADRRTAVVIATPSFAQDLAALRATLQTAARFIGVIGSMRKRERLLALLVSEGCTTTELSRITMPVGLAIGAETPAEIAISIVAQLIETRRAHGAPCDDAPTGRRPIPADGDLQTAAPPG